MNAFEYASPSTKKDAVELLSEKPDKTVVLAGGTDLLSLMKDNVAAPERVVSIKSIGELGGISYDTNRGLRIGALVTLDELVGNAQVQEDYPSLVQAIDGIRSPQLQSMGTVTGELCQRPRCWYYRSGFGLLAMQNGKSMVLEGDNRYHAILGNAGPAYFVNPSSMAPALIALGAHLKIYGPNGERDTPLEKFFRVPKTDGEKEYNLASNEIVTDILVPPVEGHANATYEVRQKEALDWPLAAAAVSLEIRGGEVRAARVVLGHVAPTPWVSSAAEKAITGKTHYEANAKKAGQAAVQGAKPLSMNGYKVRLARVAVTRAILRAGGKEV